MLFDGVLPTVELLSILELILSNPPAAFATKFILNLIFIIQFSSVAQSCPTLCDPMNHSTQSLPVYHQLPEFTKTHAHPVADAIQPSHPLSSPSPPAANPSQHQSLFQWVNSSQKIWSFSFSISPSKEHLGLISFKWTGWISLQDKGLSRIFSIRLQQSVPSSH